MMELMIEINKRGHKALFIFCKIGLVNLNNLSTVYHRCSVVHSFLLGKNHTNFRKIERRLV